MTLLLLLTFLIPIPDDWYECASLQYSLTSSTIVTHWERQWFCRDNPETGRTDTPYIRDRVRYQHKRTDIDLDFDGDVDLKDYQLVQLTAGRCIRTCTEEPI